MKTIKEIGIENLKEGQTIQFAKDTWAICFNDEIELSNMKGTIAQNDFADKELVQKFNDGKIFQLATWVKMEKHLEDFDEWENQIMFTKDGDGGTQIEYLLSAKIIEEES
tara:strand:+ start:188 stop:517 length:330 start_codon:yes stop_codon:yes gene_type:complete